MHVCPSNVGSCSVRGYIECCRWLIANRANLTAEDNSGRTPVALAEVSFAVFLKYFLMFFL